MEFVASLTRNAGELNTMLKLWQQHGDEREPFKNVMITPLFMPTGGMKVITKWREQGVINKLYFDSGGFYVQMGRINYVDLFGRLLRLYQQQQWADYYVLPDHVPTSSDPEGVVWAKVRDTAEYGRMFHELLPGNLQSKAIPVIHGFTSEQINYSLDALSALEPDYCGFGSFSTSGRSSSINKLTSRTHGLLIQMLQRLSDLQVRLHAFGVSTPPVLHLLQQIKTFSFDSIGWMKTAGFGKIYMPFIRAYNITYNDKTAKPVTPKAFQEMKDVTGHSCYFCRSFMNLHENRFYRIMHNLCVILDMVSGQYPTERIEFIMERYSGGYHSMLKG